MLFLLSWRWLRWWCVCYARCTLRATFGAALWSDAIRGGASFVRLASYPRDYFGSPRLEPGFPPPRLGFHPTSEGYPIGDLAPGWAWRQVYGACSPLLLPCTFGALALLVAPARGALDAALDVALASLRLGILQHSCCLLQPLFVVVHSTSPLDRPLVALSLLRAVQHPRCFSAAAKVPVSSVGCSLCQGPPMACESLRGLACKSPLGRFLWAITLCRKPHYFVLCELPI
ncbi:hypothetical protein V6N13_059642 [Hibiscus sabdariffa]|uniref:Secreted protein n=1 Tax=Hibiscus sabdariffa TaxID=183260 RepID=A0ABR2GCF4_9ROSI